MPVSAMVSGPFSKPVGDALPHKWTGPTKPALASVNSQIASTHGTKVRSVRRGVQTKRMLLGMAVMALSIAIIVIGARLAYVSYKKRTGKNKKKNEHTPDESETTPVPQQRGMGTSLRKRILGERPIVAPSNWKGTAAAGACAVVGALALLGAYKYYFNSTSPVSVHEAVKAKVENTTSSVNTTGSTGTQVSDPPKPVIEEPVVPSPTVTKSNPVEETVKIALPPIVEDSTPPVDPTKKAFEETVRTRGVYGLPPVVKASPPPVDPIKKAFEESVSIRGLYDLAAYERPMNGPADTGPYTDFETRKIVMRTPTVNLTIDGSQKNANKIMRFTVDAIDETNGTVTDAEYYRAVREVFGDNGEGRIIEKCADKQETGWGELVWKATGWPWVLSWFSDNPSPTCPRWADAPRKHLVDMYDSNLTTVSPLLLTDVPLIPRS